MFLHKHPNNIWYIHYDDPSGRHLKRSTRCSVKSEALKFLKNWEHREKDAQESLQKVRLSEFRNRYLEHVQNKLVSKSVRGISKVLSDMITAMHDPVMRNIRVLDVAAFIDKRHSEVSLWSARHYYGMLASAFETAVTWDIMTVNPFRKVRKPKPPAMLPLFFSQEEFQRYLTVIDSPSSKRYRCLQS